MHIHNGSAAIWENPPAPTKRRKLTPDSPFVVDLKANPGRWARFAEYGTPSTADKTAGRIRSGTAAWCQPAGAFEAVDRGRVVYVRYLGAALNGGAR